MHRSPNRPVSILEVKALTAICLIPVFAFLYPYHLAPITNFYTEWTAFALGFLGCLVFLGNRFWEELRCPKVALYLVALLVVVAIQGALIPRTYVAQSLMPAIYLLWAILLTVVAVSMKARFGLERIVALLAWSFFLGGLLQAFTGLVQYLGVAGWLGALVAFRPTSNVIGNIGQANHFATHITLGATGAIFLYSRGKLSGFLAIPVVSFLAFIVTLSGSRSVAIYSAGLIALAAHYYFKSRDRSNLKLLNTSIWFFVIFLCSQYALAWLNPWLAEQLALITLNPDPFTSNTAIERLPDTSQGLQLRTSEWQKAWVMFSQSPSLGVGTNNYAWHSFKLQALPEFSGLLKPDLFSHPHNLFAATLAETGAIGLLVVVLMLVTWMVQFRRQQPSLEHWLVSGALLTLFIHSNLEFPLWYSFFLGIAAFLVGLVDNRTFQIKFSPALGRLASLFGLLLIGSTLVGTLLSFNKIASLGKLPVEAQEKINILLTHGGNPILRPYTDATLVDMMPTSNDAIEEKLSITTRAFHRNPTPLRAYKHTTFVALNGQAGEAKQLLDDVGRAYPSKLPFYLEFLKKYPEPEIAELREYGLTLPGARLSPP